jgi:hypothetical protein
VQIHLIRAAVSDLLDQFHALDDAQPINYQFFELACHGRALCAAVRLSSSMGF